MLFLKPGDGVEIIAPSSKKKTLQASTHLLERSEHLLMSWGLIPRHSPDIFGPHVFYATPTEQRLSNFIQAMEASDTNVLWALRGGCGATRLIPSLLKKTPPSLSKVLIGFSDITALHLLAYQEWGWTCIHGPTLSQLEKAHKIFFNTSVSNPTLRQSPNRRANQPPAEEPYFSYWHQGTLSLESVLYIKKLLFGELDVLEFNHLKPLNHLAETLEQLEAPVTGGNLSLIQMSLGTPWQMQAQDHLIFLEDVNEQAYRTSERLEHLRQVGLFHKAKGIILGTFTFSDAHLGIKESKLYPPLWKEFARSVQLPVYRTPEFGHGPWNMPFILGAQGTLTRPQKGLPIQALGRSKRAPQNIRCLTLQVPPSLFDASNKRKK